MKNFGLSYLSFTIRHVLTNYNYSILITRTMRVGILSMQEVKNYGSFLQAFSLKRKIEDLGHQCEFINIVPGRQIGNYKQDRFHKIKLLIERAWGWDFHKRLSTIYKFQTRFSKEFLPALGVSKDAGKGHFDIVVIGSDEVFNCSQMTWFGFSPQLYGDGLDADKVISYAASFGATTLNSLQEMGVKEEVARMLGNFTQISVRDENSMEVVQQLTGTRPLLHVDPTFLLDFSQFVPQTQHEGNYIIVYSYPGRISDPDEIDSIKNFAKRKGLRLLSIGHYFPWCDDVVVPTPFEVLSWFRDAAYVVTDTFHGSVFSIKFNKKFCTIVRQMNTNKLSYLLQQFGLENRIVSDMNKLADILDAEIDYNPINDIITQEMKRSMDYLIHNIS